MPAGDELQQPVGYDDRWLWLALLALLVALVYYASVLWWTRPRRAARPPRRTPRRAHLTRLDDIEAAVSDGRISAREGHQGISTTVRSFVAEASGVPASAMTLADLERDGPEPLAEVIALVYPPEFGTDEALAQQAFGDAVGRARGLVSTWT
jgi:hypothetical protein